MVPVPPRAAAGAGDGAPRRRPRRPHGPTRALVGAALALLTAWAAPLHAAPPALAGTDTLADVADLTRRATAAVAGDGGAAAATAALAPVFAAPGLAGTRLSVHVVRLDDGTELFARGADTLLVPASNVKLVTAAAALRLLGPDYQFPTEIFARLGPDGTVVGDLAVRGYGDPYLVAERIWALAARLAFLGVRVVTGDLVVDDSYFAGDRRAIGWEQDHTQSAYMAPAGALSAAFNAVQIHVLAGEVGTPARVLTDPASDFLPVHGQVATVARGPSRVRLAMRHGAIGDALEVGGTLARGSTRHYWRRVGDPPLFFAALLRRALASQGIVVAGGQRAAAVPAGLPKLAEHASSRLAELLAPLNKYSNNFMAAQLALAVGAQRGGAPGTWDKGRAAIEAFLVDEVGLAPGSFVLGNASGLHEVNRFSARQMTQLLGYMHGQPALAPEFTASLAVAGGLGTLQERMGRGPAARQLRAKTGTLARACALSGYVRAAGGTPLAFSFIANGHRRIDQVWAAQDRMGAALATLALPPPAPPAATSQVPPAPTAVGVRLP